MHMIATVLLIAPLNFCHTVSIAQQFAVSSSQWQSTCESLEKIISWCHGDQRQSLVRSAFLPWDNL